MSELIDIVRHVADALRAAIPGFDRWFWLALFFASLVLGARHVIQHMRHGRVSIGGATIGTKSRTDEGGATMFRSAESVARRPSLSPFYGRPAWLRMLPYPALVVLAWLWVYAPWALVTLAFCLTAYAGLRIWQALSTAQHRREIVRPLAAVLAPALEERPARILEGIVLPKNWQDDDAEVVIPLPDHHRPDQISQAARLVAARLGGDWNHARSGHAPYTLTFRHKPAPPSYLEFRDVAPLLRQGSLETPLMGLGCDLAPLRIDFGGAVAHLGLSAGTGAGKSTLIRLLVMQLAFHGVRDFVGIDSKLVSFAGLEGVPGMRIYNGEITEMWSAIEETRFEMDDRYNYLARNPDAKFPPKFLILEEQNDFALETKIVWEEIKSKGDKAKAPVWNDIARLLLKARQVNIRLIGVYQRMTAEVAGGASDGTLRDMYGDKGLSRFSHQAWDSLVGTRPRAQSSEVQGRWVHVRGGLHRQVQVPYVTSSDVMNFLDTAPQVTYQGHQVPLMQPRPEPLPAASPQAVPPKAGRRPYEIAGALGDSGDGDTPQTEDGTVVWLADRQKRAQSFTGTFTQPAPAAPEKRYTLEEACESGIIPLSYEAAKRRRTRARDAGRPFPDGIKEGRATVYTARELRDWWQTESEAEKKSS
ncbi:hypothetical protein AB0O28_39355 [Microbispora sp. NPDC088329]|uniref:hypothetical protein n=1 Tax=Microbispora sp. NPDC088329 TaxID=3154869 RepID=UPI0034392156